MNIFKKLVKHFEATSAAAALAEGGEREMALEIMKEYEEKTFKGSRGGRPIGSILPSPSVSE